MIDYANLKAPIIRSNTRHAKILNILSNVCLTVEPVAAARVSAALVYRGNIVSIGVNTKRTHTFQARFSKNEKAISMHAENSAIYRATKQLTRQELSKSILYVCRIKHLQENQNIMIHGSSCPCSGCMKAIERHSIKTVIYTTEHLKYGEQFVTMHLP
jgi:tRNA(Arg) A34 adenosine deaminase TadA